MRPGLIFAVVAAVFAFSFAAFAGPPVAELARALAGAFYSPLTASEIQKAETAPIGPDDTTDRHTQTIGTTEVALFDEDLDEAFRVNTAVQNLRIVNRNGTNTLCVWFKALDEDCGATCEDAPLTCNGTATDGEPIPPGGVLGVPVAGGLACTCAIASGSGTIVTASRIVRDRER